MRKGRRTDGTLSPSGRYVPHEAHRRLSRGSRLVPATLRRVGAAEPPLCPARRRGAPLRPRGAQRTLFAGVQPGEPVRLPARTWPVDIPHPALAEAPGAAGGPRRQRKHDVRLRTLEGDAARRAGAARTALPALGRDQRPVAGRRGGHRSALPGAREGEHRRERRGDHEVRDGRGARRRRRGETGEPRDGRRGARTGGGAPARWTHHARRDARREVPVRHQRLPGDRLLRSLSGRRLPDDERGGAGGRRLRRGRREERPARGGHHAAGGDHRAGRAHLALDGARRRRDRVPGRRSRREALLLRRECAVELRRRRAERRRLRPVAQPRGLSRGAPGRGTGRGDSVSATLSPAGEAVASTIPEPAKRMRFGYWLPVFGGWLRNVEDERMDASWAYTRRLAQRSEEIGFDLTLIAELFLNDIKGADAPALDPWSTAAALAPVTERLELMVAVRPQYHPPG